MENKSRLQVALDEAMSRMSGIACYNFLHETQQFDIEKTEFVIGHTRPGAWLVIQSQCEGKFKTVAVADLVLCSELTKQNARLTAEWREKIKNALNSRRDEVKAELKKRYNIEM